MNTCNPKPISAEVQQLLFILSISLKVSSEPHPATRSQGKGTARGICSRGTTLPQQCFIPSAFSNTNCILQEKSDNNLQQKKDDKRVKAITVPTLVRSATLQEGNDNASCNSGCHGISKETRDCTKKVPTAT